MKTKNATFTIPAEHVALFRREVDGEMHADLQSGTNKEHLPKLVALLGQHGALLDQLGWDDPETEIDRAVTGEIGFLAGHIEGVMHTVSDDIAAAVGEYRKGRSMCPADVAELARTMLWLAETADELPLRVTEEVAARWRQRSRCRSNTLRLSDITCRSCSRTAD